MADLAITDIPDDVYDALTARARRHGRSLEAEVLAIITAAVLTPIDNDAAQREH